MNDMEWSAKNIWTSWDFADVHQVGKRDSHSASINIPDLPALHLPDVSWMLSFQNAVTWVGSKYIKSPSMYFYLKGTWSPGPGFNHRTYSLGAVCGAGVVGCSLGLLLSRVDSQLRERQLPGAGFRVCCEESWTSWGDDDDDDDDDDVTIIIFTILHLWRQWEENREYPVDF